MDRLRIFNRRGDLEAEFIAAVSRSWIIGKRTTASFSIPVYETYCTEDVLEFGNWVLVESDELPDWAGTIVSREWGARVITIGAYSPEHLISQRIGPTEKRFKGSAGELFVKLLEYVNIREDTLLKPGEIYKSGTRQETLTPTRLSDDLKRIYERSREEYQWRPVVNANGKLTVYGDWVLALGTESEFTLHEGTGGGNIEATNRVLMEDVPQANYLHGYGNGITWASRPQKVLEDTDSISRYGLIQQSEAFRGASTLDGVEKNVRGRLLVKAKPARVYNVNALDVGDTFTFMQLGNVMNLKMQNIGFNGSTLGTIARVRIIGMYYKPDNANKVELALKEKL